MSGCHKYYENEKKNAVATKITDSAVSTLKQSINEQFIEVLASNIFEQTNHISEQMEENDKFAYFQNKLENLNENLIGYSKMIDTFIAGNSELSQAVAEAKGSIPGLSDKVSDGAKSFGTARSSLDDTKTSLKSFSENVNQTMTSINDSMNYDDLKLHDPDDFFSLLVHTGYLTAVDNPLKNNYIVKIPNEEIKYIVSALSNINHSTYTTAPTEYIQHLFDQYAKNYDKHLEL